VARETRRQRRDARRAADEQAPPRTTPRPVPAGPEPAVAVERPRRGGFIRESIGELNKVEWPNRAQVIQGTIVVIVACVIVGAYLWGADQVLRPFVRDVLLGQ
jgi:preprotein translocase subunit SecE